MVKNISTSTFWIEPASSDIKKESGTEEGSELYVVKMDSEVMRTPKGLPISHHDSRALRELVSELEFTNKLDVSTLSLYSMICTYIDNMKGGQFDFSYSDIEYMALNDPVIRVCAGPEVADQMKFLHVVVEFLEAKEIPYPNMPQTCHMESFADMDQAEYAKPSMKKLIELLHHTSTLMNDFQKTAFINVMTIYSSPLLGLMLVLRQITPAEFAVALLTAWGVNSKTFSDCSRKEEIKAKEQISLDAECMVRFLDQFRNPWQEIEQVILAGENIYTEFKSTLRTNLNTGSADKKMEHAVLKTIAAFLNTDGGSLFVGIADSGELVGISADKFKNDDKYLLHFTNIVHSGIGKKHADYLKWDLVPYKSDKVLHVKCRPSPEPVFLNFLNEEQFYIRSGPATVSLNPSELLSYSKKHFDR